MTHRIYNFSAGPAGLPTPVLEQVQKELLSYQGSGMSIMEMSHRGPYFDEVLQAAEAQARSIMKLPDSYAILFLQGGASHQFAMAPLNFASKERPVAMIHTGYWTLKAINEIKRIADCRIIASGEESGFRKLPELELNHVPDNSCYLHYCSNNTIYGTQWANFIHKPGVPSIVDMSSDFLSREMDFSQFDMIYAGAQKNLGPSGLAIVAIKKDWAETASEKIPLIFQYRAHIENGSRYHTPPTFAIYIARLVLDWIQDQGGLTAIEKMNNKKAELLYSALDHLDLYQPSVDRDSRSKMNVVFRIDQGNEKLEEQFVREAAELGMDGLKAHRHTGGIRASIYNAMPLKGVEQLVSFMEDFQKKWKK